MCVCWVSQERSGVFFFACEGYDFDLASFGFFLLLGKFHWWKQYGLNKSVVRDILNMFGKPPDTINTFQHFLSYSFSVFFSVRFCSFARHWLCDCFLSSPFLYMFCLQRENEHVFSNKKWLEYIARTTKHCCWRKCSHCHFKIETCATL